jgi:hypothetical protein
MHGGKVYLCGKMAGLTLDQMAGWRLQAAKFIEARGHFALDPVKLEMAGEPPEEIVRRDLICIRKADAVLVNGNIPGWGSAIEVGFANACRVPVVTFKDDPDTRAHPGVWLPVHSQFYYVGDRCFEAALARVVKVIEERYVANGL